MRRLAVATLCLVVPGCTLLRLSQDIEDIDASATIAGQVVVEVPTSRPVRVVLLRREASGDVSLRQWLTLAAGKSYYYFLITDPGAYRIAAFVDTDGDFAWGAEEVGGLLAEGGELSVRARDRYREKDLRVWRQGPPDGLAVALDESGVAETILTGSVGEVVDIDSDRFGPEAGKAGFWQPLTALKKYGFGMFLLEEYDPKRIPVVFVHGSSGHAQLWKPLLTRLPKQFQPILFQYPSGFRLAGIGASLDTSLRLLQQRLHFTRVHVVAHSMGGLVARHAILRNASAGHRYLDRFVALATPWGGHPAAETGVERSPVVVPNWRDMTPDSAFLAELYEDRMPIEFTLLFAYKGQTSMLRPDANDGVIPLSSALDPRAQREAAHMFGFAEGHVGMLTNPAVHEHLIRVLSE